MNYQIMLDKYIEALQKQKRVPRLLLHACCAPCSSYCLEYLSKYFHITLFFYNPNIGEKEEYDKRYNELTRLVSQMNMVYRADVIRGEYEPERFYEMARGLEKVSEGGERCFKCYELRLREAAIYAKEEGYDCFTTTLSISPHKNAQKLNKIGSNLSDEYCIDYLFSDFKKKNGFKRSIELSEQYNLYRQNYCGCIYSKSEKNVEKE